MSKVSFILPYTTDIPIGGYKIVYQYANELSRRGHQVTIHFLYRVVPKTRFFWLEKLKRFKNKFKFGDPFSGKVTWFNLNSKIKIRYGVISPSEIIDGDIVIATAAPTAFFVNKLPNKKGKKFYFIQNFENWWFHNESRLLDSYRLGMHNIVISKDLMKKVKFASGIEPSYLPNFYDRHEFYLENSIENRRNVVSLLSHKQKTKRTDFGLEVLAEVKKKIPDLEVELFGNFRPTCQLPDYVNFTYKASPATLRSEIFGRSKVYLLPSTLEGWGLTGMEAMASGAALVASNIGGIEDYANNSNSFLIDINDKEGYVKAILKIISDDLLRERLSKKSLEDLSELSLEKATTNLEVIISE